MRLSVGMVGAGSRSGLWLKAGRWRRRPRPRASACAARASGLAAIGLKGELGLRDRSSAPRRVANCTTPERVEAIRKLRSAALHRRRDRRDAWDGADGVGILTRSGMGRLGGSG